MGEEWALVTTSNTLMKIVMSKNLPIIMKVYLHETQQLTSKL